MADAYITALLEYGQKTGLVPPEDAAYVRNRLLDAMGMDGCDVCAAPANASLEDTLAALCQYAASAGKLPPGAAAADAFSTQLMGCLTPPPSAVIAEFRRRYVDSPKAATDFFYQFSQDTDYIRRYRVSRDLRWQAASPYGELELSINLSKPEKDPSAIAAAGSAPAAGYPACALCRETEGYAGSSYIPARQNHRLIPISLCAQPWFLQYSPYTYYNEHCIVLSEAHTPMRISGETFRLLLDFVGLFPHYFVGSNADLPIVGGSILSHNHFQGGCHTFPMERAAAELRCAFPDFPDVEAETLRWPLSTLRLRSAKVEPLAALCESILGKWRGYSDIDSFIYAYTDAAPHNTITPIARMRDGKYEMDLILRNNITTAEHPLGVFHPHAALHHIKKENIGLIEAMGMAILPPRLDGELRHVAAALATGTPIPEDNAIHTPWAAKVAERHPELNAQNAHKILLAEVGLVFAQVLEDCGVYKRTPAGQQGFARCIEALGGKLI